MTDTERDRIALAIEWIEACEDARPEGEGSPRLILAALELLKDVED